MLNRISLSILCLAVACSQASAVLITDSIDVTSGTGSVFPGSTPSQTITGLSFTDAASGVTLTYDLTLDLDWLDGTGASVAAGLFQGDIHYGGGPGNLGIETTLLGAGSIDDEHRDVDAFNYTDASGGTSAIREELTFTITNVVASGGSYNGSYDFTAYTTGNMNNMGVLDNLTTPALQLTVMPGADPLGNTDNSDFRLANLTVQFDVTPTAVPEPGSLAFLSLIGVFAAGRRWRKARKLSA